MSNRPGLPFSAIASYRRPIIAVGCAISFAALLATYIVNQRSWQEQARSLRRENLSLQARELTSGIEKEFSGLDAAARVLAGSEGLNEWVQQEPAAGRPEAAPLDAKTASQLRVDSIAIATAGQTFRYSA